MILWKQYYYKIEPYNLSPPPYKQFANGDTFFPVCEGTFVPHFCHTNIMKLNSVFFSK